ncbi:MAG: hypothetical protein ABIS06_03480 [Vicinamibacterales bacterium]
MTRRPSLIRSVLALAGAVLITVTPSGKVRKFYDDDPLAREPESQDASAVQEQEIDLFFDLAQNLFTRPGDQALDVRAGNVNTIDEVPDSNWFTNRILARPLSIEEAIRGPLTGRGPAPGTWVVVRPKRAGFAPGFTMRDGEGATWFVSFDGKGHPEAATGAILVANRIFWSLGYWQVENYLVTVRPDQLTIADTASVVPQSGKPRQMRSSDLDAVLRRAHRSVDGSYRAIAARAVEGKPVGGFRYYGTRGDDPNDVVPHEHRRELRALKIFGAWTNLVDMKAGNTLDTVIQANGRSVVRHYLQDVGSTFGTGANGPREYDEGSEHLFEGSLALKRLYTFGLFLQPWQTVDYVENAAIGRFEGKTFDPTAWKPRVPTAAFRRARADDSFWAARRVMAFTDDMIRALVKTGIYKDPAAEKLLSDVLIERRNKIGVAYLNGVNPVVDVALDASGALTFDNAAVRTGVAQQPPAGGYTVQWARFDNNTGEATALGDSKADATGRTQAPVALPVERGSYLKVEIRAVRPQHAAWSAPVAVFFRRDGGWRLIGFERLP